jgi:hypothetical protein
MKLSTAEKRMRDGAAGAARQMAIELIVRYAEVLGADRLCRIGWADLFCGSHHYLEVAGSDDFDTVFSKMSLCSDRTVPLENMAGHCICYSGVEADCTEVPDQMLMAPDRRARNLSWLSRFVDAGVVLSGNCIPYLTGFVPLAGEHFVSCESSAVLFINSVWGGRGNGDGIEASFCAAVCGRTPYWGKHLSDNRRATIIVEIRTAPRTVHDWDALGQTVGSRLPAHSVPVLTGDFAKPNAIQLKSFFASLACAAGTELCHITGLTPEAPATAKALEGNQRVDRLSVTPADQASMISSLNPHRRQKIDYVSLGCPHYHIDEIRRIAGFLDGKKVNPDTTVHVWTAGTIKYQADRCGYTRIIERAGAKLLTGSCPSSRGYPDGVHTAAYDSAKQRKSAEQETDAKLFYGSRQQCLQTAISGSWEGC